MNIPLGLQKLFGGNVPSEIRPILCFLNFMGSNDELTGIALVRKQCNEIIRQIRLSPPSHDPLCPLESASDALFDRLESEEAKQYSEFYSNENFMSTSPILAFLLYSLTNQGQFRQAFEIFGLSLLERLHYVRIVSPRHLEAASRLLRQFMQFYDPLQDKELHHLTSDLLKKVIKRRAVRLEWNSESLTQAEALIERMFNEKSFKEEQNRSEGYSRQNLGRALYYREEILNDGSILIVSSDVPEGAMREGETEADHVKARHVAIPEDPLSPDGRPDRAGLWRRMSVFNYRHFMANWDIRYHKRYEIGLLFVSLFSSPPGLELTILLAFVESAVFLGIDLDDFLGIKLGAAKETGSLESDSPSHYYLSDDGIISYEIPVDAIGYTKKMVLSGNTEESSRIVRFKLPLTLANLYHDLRYTGEKKRTSLFTPELRQTAVTIITSFLKSFNDEYKLHVTPASLSRTFRGLAQKLGLDEIYASYISNSSSWMRTQRYYVYVRSHHFHLEIYRFLNKLRQSIVKTLNGASARRPWIVPPAELMAHLECEKLQAVELGNFGSKIFPKPRALMAFFSGIVSILNSLPLLSKDDVEAYHNLFTVYVYIVVQFAVALRPIADPPLDIEGVDYVGSLVLVHDKNSLKFEETRLVQVAPIIIRLLRQLSAGGRATLISLSLPRPAGGRPLFFLLKKGSIVAITPTAIRETLDAHGLLSLYDFPLNSPRAFLRTELLLRNVDQDLIDALLNHVRLRRDFYDQYSTADVSSLKILRDEIEQILGEIGVKELQYRR